MTTADNTVIQALTALIDEVESLARFEPGDLGGGDYWTIDDKREARRLHVRCLSAIDRYAPPDSAYRRQAASMEGDPSWVAELASVLTALRDDYRDGVMRPFTELVHAAVFDDFLEMAAELDGKQFHAPAAVLAGSVLEEHLRKLADKAGIAVHDDRGRAKSVEALGVGLVKSGTISDLHQ